MWIDSTDTITTASLTTDGAPVFNDVLAESYSGCAWARVQRTSPRKSMTALGMPALVVVVAKAEHAVVVSKTPASVP